MNFVKKTLGLILLFLGIAVIFSSLYFSFNIFTAKASAPEIFKIEDAFQSKGAAQGIEAQVQEILSEQLKGMIPVDSVPTLLNLISWSIFAGILIFGGSQISNLGIKLIK